MCFFASTQKLNFSFQEESPKIWSLGSKLALPAWAEEPDPAAAGAVLPPAFVAPGLQLESAVKLPKKSCEAAEIHR